MFLFIFRNKLLGQPPTPQRIPRRDARDDLHVVRAYREDCEEDLFRGCRADEDLHALVLGGCCRCWWIVLDGAW